MRALVLTLAGLLGLAAVMPTADATASAPVIYAHRGGATHAPENTVAAFRRTHALFGDRGVWLELDTQATADGQLVVIHDDSLDRTTDCVGDVITKTLAEIAPCNAAAHFPGGWPSPVAVPTLREVFVEGRDAGWRLMVEIKDIPLEANFDAGGTKVADALVALVAETGFPTDRLLVQSFWPLALDRVERRAPAIGTVLLTTSQLPGAPAGVGFTVVANAAFAKARGYEVSSPDIGSVDFSAATVRIAHTLGRARRPVDDRRRGDDGEGDPLWRGRDHHQRPRPRVRDPLTDRTTRSGEDYGAFWQPHARQNALFNRSPAPTSFWRALTTSDGARSRQNGDAPQAAFWRGLRRLLAAPRSPERRPSSGRGRPA